MVCPMATQYSECSSGPQRRAWGPGEGVGASPGQSPEAWEQGVLLSKARRWTL